METLYYFRKRGSILLSTLVIGASLGILIGILTPLPAFANHRFSDDLSVIDESLFGESRAISKQPLQGILGKSPIRSQDVYRGYLEKAANISSELMLIRKEMNKNNGTLSLQRLGAFTQALDIENRMFHNQFEHGETEFLSYRLIQTAVTHLNEALSYWRQADKYRRSHRGSTLSRAEDDEVLRVKLQTARQAIDELHVIIETRQALNQDLQLGY